MPLDPRVVDDETLQRQIAVDAAREATQPREARQPTTPLPPLIERLVTWAIQTDGGYRGIGGSVWSGRSLEDLRVVPESKEVKEIEPDMKKNASKITTPLPVSKIELQRQAAERIGKPLPTGRVGHYYEMWDTADPAKSIVIFEKESPDDVNYTSIFALGSHADCSPLGLTTRDKNVVSVQRLMGGNHWDAAVSRRITKSQPRDSRNWYRRHLTDYLNECRPEYVRSPGRDGLSHRIEFERAVPYSYWANAYDSKTGQVNNIPLHSLSVTEMNAVVDLLVTLQRDLIIPVLSNCNGATGATEAVDRVLTTTTEILLYSWIVRSRAFYAVNRRSKTTPEGVPSSAPTPQTAVYPLGNDFQYLQSVIEQMRYTTKPLYTTFTMTPETEDPQQPKNLTTAAQRIQSVLSEMSSLTRERLRQDIAVQYLKTFEPILLPGTEKGIAWVETTGYISQCLDTIADQKSNGDLCLDKTHTIGAVGVLSRSGNVLQERGGYSALPVIDNTIAVRLSGGRSHIQKDFRSMVTDETPVDLTGLQTTLAKAMKGIEQIDEWRQDRMKKRPEELNSVMPQQIITLKTTQGIPLYINAEQRVAVFAAGLGLHSYFYNRAGAHYNYDYYVPNRSRDGQIELETPQIVVTTGPTLGIGDVWGWTVYSTTNKGGSLIVVIPEEQWDAFLMSGLWQKGAVLIPAITYWQGWGSGPVVPTPSQTFGSLLWWTNQGPNNRCLGALGDALLEARGMWSVATQDLRSKGKMSVIQRYAMADQIASPNTDAHVTGMTETYIPTIPLLLALPKIGKVVEKMAVSDFEDIQPAVAGAVHRELGNLLVYTWLGAMRTTTDQTPLSVVRFGVPVKEPKEHTWWWSFPTDTAVYDRYVPLPRVYFPSMGDIHIALRQSNLTHQTGGFVSVIDLPVIVDPPKEGAAKGERRRLEWSVGSEFFQEKADEKAESMDNWRDTYGSIAMIAYLLRLQRLLPELRLTRTDRTYFWQLGRRESSDHEKTGATVLVDYQGRLLPADARKIMLAKAAQLEKQTYRMDTELPTPLLKKDSSRLFWELGMSMHPIGLSLVNVYSSTYSALYLEYLRAGVTPQNVRYARYPRDMGTESDVIGNIQGVQVGGYGDMSPVVAVDKYDIRHTVSHINSIYLEQIRCDYIQDSVVKVIAEIELRLSDRYPDVRQRLLKSLESISYVTPKALQKQMVEVIDAYIKVKGKESV